MEHFSALIEWYMAHISYWTVALLMAIESTFIPLPSEVVVPPAAYLAAQGKMSAVGILLAGTIGALTGALINYFLAIKLGRVVLYKLVDTRIAHALLVRKEGMEKAEEFFRKNGRSSTFVGRLIPGIRHLISIPAGIARMDLKQFVLFTSLGAALWNLVLIVLGYLTYTQKDLLEPYYKELSLVLLALGVLFIAYLIWNGLRSKK